MTPEDAKQLEQVEVLVLSTADYDAAVWTNKQHLASRLSKYLDVTYVGSVGLRRPRTTRADLTRIVNRVSSRRSTVVAAGDGSTSPARLTVVPARVIPYHGLAVVDFMNRLLLSRSIKNRRGKTRVLWTFSPFTLGAEDSADYVVYHSVDLLHAVDGVPAEALLRAESQLVKRADVIIASSKGVLDHLVNLGSTEVLLWENVADTALFATRSGARISRAIFAGHLTREKVDVELLQAMANEGIDIALAGPISIDGTRVDGSLQELLDTPGVQYLGNLDLQSLAHEVGRSMIGLVPYRLNQYTDGVFPMKIYEYLAAGLSVVSTKLPSLTESHINGLQLVEADNFIDTVRRRLAEFSEHEADRRAKEAEKHSWENRVVQSLQLIGTKFTSTAAQSVGGKYDDE